MTSIDLHTDARSTSEPVRNPEHPASISANTRPLLITVDTEGDNSWSAPSRITTRNADFLERFQRLCESYRLKPTWLTNWEMAHSEAFCELAADALRRGTAEVGMHLHAWSSPPIEPLTPDDFRHQPYLIEYARPLMFEKIRRMTSALEDRFCVKIVSHRAGRWALNETYVQLLIESGYRADCSVTPRQSWRPNLGDPLGVGGSDYTTFPDRPYWIDPQQISRPGRSPLLEVPMTIVPGAQHAVATALRRVARISVIAQRAVNRCFPRNFWLRPARGNRGRMLRLLAWVEQERVGHASLMLHSSELMPGGSPRFPTPASVERLYANLEQLFAAAQGRFTGMTLDEYRQHVERHGLADGQSTANAAADNMTLTNVREAKTKAV